jgi:hypothetical protein
VKTVPEETKESKTLEMRVAELEDKLARVTVSEEEMAAAGKVAAVTSTASPATCVISQCIQQCVISQCIQQCVISQCIIQHCIISNCIRQCIKQCFECSCGPCLTGGGGVGGAGFGGLGM